MRQFIGHIHYHIFLTANHFSAFQFRQISLYLLRRTFQKPVLHGSKLENEYTPAYPSMSESASIPVDIALSERPPLLRSINTSKIGPRYHIPAAAERPAAPLQQQYLSLLTCIAGTGAQTSQRAVDIEAPSEIAAREFCMASPKLLCAWNPGIHSFSVGRKPGLHPYPPSDNSRRISQIHIISACCLEYFACSKFFFRLCHVRHHQSRLQTFLFLLLLLYVQYQHQPP